MQEEKRTEMFKDDPANGTIRKEFQVLSSEKISATFVKKMAVLSNVEVLNKLWAVVGLLK